MLVVAETLVGTAVKALVAIEQVRLLIPHVAQTVDVESIFGVALLDDELALLRCGEADLHEADTLAIEEFLHLVGILLSHLHDDARILGKEVAHDVAALEATQVDADASLAVGEAHLEERRHQSAGRDIVTRQNPSAAHHLLYGIESIAEILSIEAHLLVGIGISHIVAHAAQRLCKGCSAQLRRLEREVDVVEIGVLVVHQHGRHHLADVCHLCTSADDDRSGCNHFRAVGIFLRHRERVFSRRNVHTDALTEATQRIDGTIEARILALLRAAGPHPVGRETHAVDTVGQRSPHDVCQRLGNGEDAASLGRDESCLRSMSQSGGDAFAAAIVEGHHTTVAQRQLYLALTLLAGYLARHGAVHLVGEPVFAGHSFQAEHLLDIAF